MLYEFKSWLENNGYDAMSVKSRYSNCERVEGELGVDLDEEYEKDGMEELLSKFQFSKEDARIGKRAQHGIVIRGDVYNGTATLRSALNLYQRFKKNPEQYGQVKCAATVRKPKCTKTLDGHAETKRAVIELDIDIARLVARTAIWAPLQEHLACNRRAKTPNVRRKKPGETRGLNSQGVRFDDNSYPNSQMKAVLRKHYSLVLENYETCHVWPKTCYDERYHTCFANLVLLPREIAAFSDHNEKIQKILQYRAFEIFRWYPDEEDEPIRPESYPTDWFSLDS